MRGAAAARTLLRKHAAAGVLCFVAAACGGEKAAGPVAPPAPDGPPVITDKYAPQLPPAPYNPDAAAHAAVDAALEAAAAEGKRVVITFGANWCTDCRVLAAAFELPQIATFIDEHFETVKVDMGKLDRNLDVVARFDFEKFVHVPTVVIAEPDGTVVNASTSREWFYARERNPQDVADYLYKYAGVK